MSSCNVEFAIHLEQFALSICVRKVELNSTQLAAATSHRREPCTKCIKQRKEICDKWNKFASVGHFFRFFFAFIYFSIMLAICCCMTKKQQAIKKKDKKESTSRNMKTITIVFLMTFFFGCSSLRYAIYKRVFFVLLQISLIFAICLLMAN